MKSLFFVVLLTLFSHVAWGGVLSPRHQVVAGGGGGGTILIGNNTLTVSSWGAVNSNGVHYDAFTAVSSGNIAKGYASLKSFEEVQSCKMVVYNSSGTLLATSNGVSVPITDTTVEFTFTSGSISASSLYYLGTICTYYVDRGYDSASWESFQYESGTYESPGNITSPADNYSSNGNMKIWITN